ncbi:MAG: TonB-dependent receptor [Pyrinomonadaceae bacterium]
MRSLFLFLLFSAMAGSVFSQGVSGGLSGAVTLPDGSPAAGARILVVARNNSAIRARAVADSKGEFSIPAPTEDMMLDVEFAAGVGKILHARTLVQKGSTERILIVVSDEPLIREDVEVNVSENVRQELSNVAKSVDVLGADEIASRDEISVADALRTLPGFRIQQLGGAGKTVSIKSRGLRSQDTAVLVDGQRIRDTASISGDASAFISDLDVAGTSAIEVMRGTGSSVFGTNAVGGVIDIATVGARPGFHGGAEAFGGSLGFSRFAGNLGIAESESRYGITGNFASTKFSEGLDGNDDSSHDTFRIRFDAAPTDRISLMARVFGSRAFARLNSGPDTTGSPILNSINNARANINFLPDTDDPDSLQRNRLLGIATGANFILGVKTILSVNFNILDTSRKNENGPLGAGFQPFGGTEYSEFSGGTKAFSLRLDQTVSRGIRLLGGFEFESEDYLNTGDGPGGNDSFFVDGTQRSNTIFGQAIGKAFDGRISFSAGIRAQTFSLSTPAFSNQSAPYSDAPLGSIPSAVTYDQAVAYRLASTGTKLRIHSGTAYRVPSLYERFGSFYSSFTQDFTAIGDPSLKPERAFSIDGGIDQSFAKGKIEISGTYFYAKLLDIIRYGSFVPDIGSTPRPFGGYENSNGGISRGIEATIWLRSVAGFHGNASFTHTNSDQSEPPVFGTDIVETFGVPKNRFSAYLSRNFGSSLVLAVDSEISDGYLAPIFSNSDFNTYIYRFNGAARTDFSGIYTLPIKNDKIRIDISGALENVFGVERFENGFRLQGRSGRLGLKFRF